MYDIDSDNSRRWIEAWKHAGPELERIRREDMSVHETPFYVAAFDSMYSYMLRNEAVRLTSGLVEQQALFLKRILTADDRSLRDASENTVSELEKDERI